MDGIFIWCLDGALLGILAGMWLRGHNLTLTLSMFLAIAGAFAGALMCMSFGASSSSLLTTLLMFMIGIGTTFMLVTRINRQ